MHPMSDYPTFTTFSPPAFQPPFQHIPNNALPYTTQIPRDSTDRLTSVPPGDTSGIIHPNYNNLNQDVAHNITTAHGNAPHEPLYISDVRLAYGHLLVSRDEEAAHLRQLEDQIAGLQRELQSVQQVYLEKSRNVQTLYFMTVSQTASYTDLGQQHQPGPSISAPQN